MGPHTDIEPKRQVKSRMRYYHHTYSAATFLDLNESSGFLKKILDLLDCKLSMVAQQQQMSMGICGLGLQQNTDVLLKQPRGAASD